jgi:hypothetical protein
MHYANGERYEGSWADNTFHGEGTFYSREGKAYTGQYILGKIDVYGDFRKKDSDIYEGELSGGVPHMESADCFTLT